MKPSISLVAAFGLWAGMAQGDAFTDSIVADLSGRGYQFIEIQDGLSQTKVEAVRGSQKLEVIYDRSTGQILKQEQERAEPDEIGRVGVQMRSRNRDFIDAAPGTTPGASAMARALVDELRADGFRYIEVKTGITQVKVEAIRGSEKLELVLDRATGAVLKREVERADADEIGRSGIEFDSRNRDFLGDDDDDDDGRRSGRDDDDDSDSRSRGDDDDDDDDDGDDDDDNSGSGSGSRSGSNSGKG